MTDKLDLCPALNLASLVTDRRTTIPILSCAFLQKGVIEATDLDLHLTVATKIAAPKAGFAVDLGRLRAAAKQTDGVVTFDDARVTIGTNPTVHIAQMKGDWPKLTDPEETVAFELPADQLAADLVAVAPAMSEEETRYYLMGMLWHVVDGTLRYAATDGHRLHRITQPAPKGSAQLAESIIPRKAIRVLAEMLKAQPDVMTVRAVFGKLKARFTVGSATLTAKLIDGTFPDYKRVIPSSADKGIRVTADELVRPAALAAKVLSKGTNGVSLHTQAKKLTGKDPEGTEIDATITLELIGDPPKCVGPASGGGGGHGGCPQVARHPAPCDGRPERLRQVRRHRDHSHLGRRQGGRWQGRALPALSSRWGEALSCRARARSVRPP